MSLKADLQAVRDRRLQVLDELEKDHAENSFARLIVRADVVQRNRKLRADNLLAGRSVTGEDIAAGTQSALLRLNARSFRDVLAQLEMFLADVFRLWLAENHGDLLDKKMVSLGTLLAEGSLEEVRKDALDRAVDTKVLELMHGTPQRWFSTSRQWFSDVGNARPLLSELVEMKATRDLLEHAGGTANQLYIVKVKAASGTPRLKPGDEAVIDVAYHARCIEVVREVIEALTRAAINAAK